MTDNTMTFPEFDEVRKLSVEAVRERGTRLINEWQGLDYIQQNREDYVDMCVMLQAVALEPILLAVRDLPEEMKNTLTNAIADNFKQLVVSVYNMGRSYGDQRPLIADTETL